MQAYLAHFVISKEKGRMTSSLLKNKMCQISLHARLFGTLEYVNKWFEEGTEKKRKVNLCSELL